MFKDKKMLSKIITSIVVLAIAFGVTLGYRAYVNRNVEEGVKNITVNVVVDTDDLQYNETYEFETEEEFLGDALVNNINVVTLGSKGSRYITEVDDISTDPSKEQWWKILINDEMGNLGMDVQPIKDEDIITIEFNIGFN